jgi:hypothetical protein
VFVWDGEAFRFSTTRGRAGHDELARPLLAKYMPERLAEPGWTPDRVIVELRPDRILVGH